MPEYANTKLRVPPDPPSVVEVAECGYAELDVVTNFSFLRGASHPDELVFRATELGYKAIGIADVNSLAGVVRAYEATQSVQKQGGNPPRLLIGSRLVLEEGTQVLVWAMNRAGYGRLCRLLTLGKRRAQKGECALKLEDVLESNQGMMAAVDGMLSNCNLQIATLKLKEAFGARLSIAAAPMYGGDDRSDIASIAKIARKLGAPLLATNHVHYHAPDRRTLQDVLTCIRHGCTIHSAGFKLFPNGERYLKTPGQMARLFSDWPGAIHRGLEIAQACSFSLEELRYEYPDEVVPTGMRPIDHLAKLTWEGAAQHYPDAIPDKVRRLIEHELKMIEQLKYEAYFLTVHDLVTFARSRGILCQGRGSAANSAVCYCIGVTSVDPARIDLLFERFVSSARGEPPDIDVDFEHERREEVIQYLYQKYGRERAGMTAEVISYRGRSAVRDVGKAMGLSLDLIDQMAKKLDWWHRGTLSQGMIQECGLDPADATVRRVIELSGQLLGFPRHLSQHVGGMVMTRGPLCEFVPIENASMPDRTVIEWDKDDIDTLGILKVDCLALGMLTCISRCFELIGSEKPLHLHTIPAEDPAVYAMIQKADTIGVFQIESRAQMSMLPRLKPKEFYDLVIEVAIVRPGPIQGNMVHPYLRRRNKEEPVSYPSKALEEVLGKTLGVPLFQEQAMKVAMVGANFSAEEADQLRRAMARWRKGGQIDLFHRKIVEGMLKNGYTREFAEQSFLQIRGFGEYGFPESHAASFALLVYVSAWLKHYHPAAFCAALLNSQPMGFYAPAQIVRDAREHGVQVHPPDANHSHWDCTLERKGAHGPSVRLGFRQIKGFHIAHAKQLIDSRIRCGPFRSIQQCHHRARLPRHALQRLAEADAFASLGLTRRHALWQVMALDDQQLPLFDDLDAPPDRSIQSLPPMPLGQEVMTDYSTAGLSLKCHPVSLVRDQLDAMGIQPANRASSYNHGKWVKVAGLVLIRQRPGTASGIVFETIEDETGIMNLIVRPNIYDRYRKAARHAALLHAEGYLERQGQVIHLMVYRLFDLSHLLSGFQLSSRDFH